jgi:hypothetical protein
MANCVYLDDCPFFNDKMANMPMITQAYKQKYCHGDCSNCARYMVLCALGRQFVPVDLFPNQQDRAEYIIVKSKDT